MPFNLQKTLKLAEAGEPGAWEAVARHLLEARKPRARKSAAGPQTWAHVVLADGREFLTSAYAKGDINATLDAHRATAQFRARMEDSGDRSDYVGDWANFAKRAFLNPAIAAVPGACRVRSIALVDSDNIAKVREQCYVQRGFRQGWIGQYRKEQQEEAARAALAAEAEARFVASQAAALEVAA